MYKNSDELLKKIVDRLKDGFEKKEIANSKDGIITSNFKGIDSIISGFVKGELIIIGGEPSVGKSAFAFNLCLNLKNKLNVYILSSEAKPSRLMERLISIHSQIPINRITSNQIRSGDWSRLSDSILEFKESNEIRIGELHFFNLEEIIQNFKNSCKDKKIDFFFIDGIQNIRVTKTETKAAELAEVSRTLKELAVKENVVIVLCSNLNRNVSNRDNFKPILSDLLGSGSLEHEADKVIFLHKEKFDNKHKQTIEFTVEKNRNGDKGTTHLNFFPKTLRFKSID